MTPPVPVLAVVGAGPRGTSVLERLTAQARALGGPQRLELHVVDPAELGSGAVWRTDQPREMCMNTLAGAVTLFVDPGVTTPGPRLPGPTLFEWCVLLRAELEPTPEHRAAADAVPPEHRATWRSHPIRAAQRPDLRADTALRDELRDLLPWSHPSRALYGLYLVWCWDRAVAALPEGWTLVTHRTRATAVTAEPGPDGDRERVHLADGDAVVADAVVLAPGWLEREPSDADRALGAVAAEHPDLLHVPPASPVDQDLSGIRPGEDVLVRGLGMGFFDTLALLTLGRGGRFEEGPDGALVYRPSGREPVVHATSRRGVPFRAKSLYGSLPPAAPHRRLRAVDWSAVPRPLDVGTAVLPLVVRDGLEEYYRTLRRVRPEAFAGDDDGGPDAVLERVLAVVEALADDPDALDAGLAPLVPGRADRLDLRAAAHPADRLVDSPAAFDAAVRAYVADDLAEAELGRDSALKAGLWSVGAARKAVAGIVAFGGATAESFEGAYRRFTAFGGMVGSGPPAFRSRQLLALVDAGLVHFVGPEATVVVDADAGVFRAASPFVTGSGVAARVLVDAWMHLHDVTRTRDPLVAGLLEAGRLRPALHPTADGGARPSAAVDVDPATSRLVRADGSLDPRVHLVGIPLDDLRGDTIISPMPGADATLLRETDAVARSVLAVLAGLDLTREGADLHA
ncbi:FAD/NAD(P)-binding protein [Cellulomonas endophytica]|uniref:FAD/NAD(P)-binding protein n=1 Tax=Cellulomonas endophytica TaxID=2494735 RepID=UPI0013E95F07|nr:FAD/NAD(P)-binding protein [Cellulomonas endophytica]